MDKLTIYCMSLQNSHLDKIKSLNYIPTGLNNDNFSKEWVRDNTGDNISYKNSYYGEYAFYYWYWKNILKFKKNFINNFSIIMAERQGFEPWVPLTVHTLSKRAL